MVKEFMEVTYI